MGCSLNFYCTKKTPPLPRTWELAAALHPVGVLAVTQTADVVAQGFDIVNTLRHHQVLLDQVAPVRTRLEKGGQQQSMMDRKS